MRELYSMLTIYLCVPDDFMLCKAENRAPEHCLKEGRRVTRCAQDLCVRSYLVFRETYNLHALNPNLSLYCT
jgi:hypothetical protein